MIGFRFALFELGEDDGEFRLRLARTDPGFESADQAVVWRLIDDALRLVIFFPGRNPPGRRKGLARPPKGWRGDAYNGEVAIIDEDLFANDAWVCREAMAPDSIAHDDGIPGARRFVFRPERTPQRRGHAEYLKVIA